jgi:hypothetical protein
VEVVLTELAGVVELLGLVTVPEGELELEYKVVVGGGRVAVVGIEEVVGGEDEVVGGVVVVVVGGAVELPVVWVMV